MPTYAVNKKARFDYEILDTYEAGLVLTGPEVKSIRAGQVKLTGAFVTFLANSARLTNAHIPKYKYAATIEDYDPDRSRVILLKKKESEKLRGKLQEKGLTIVPLSIYTKGRHIKLEIALARGKKTYDKRETIKNRDQKREIARKLKGGDDRLR